MYKNNEIKIFLKLGTTLSIISVLLICWVVYAKVDVVAQTSGKIIHEGKNQNVAVLETSTINQILVKENETVKKGQKLAVLDDTNIKTSFLQSSNELELLQLRKRAIESEASGKEFIQLENENLDNFYKVKSQIDTEKMHYQNSLLSAKAQAMQVRNEISSNLMHIEKLEKSKSSWNKQIESYNKLKETGFASPLLAEEKIREANEKIDEIKVQKQSNNISQSKLMQTDIAMNTIVSERKTQLLKERNEISQRIDYLKQEVERGKHNIELKVLSSPIDGVVKEITNNSSQSVVTEGTVLMTIVPLNENLTAQILVKNTDIGFINLEQKVKLKVETYAFQKYGLLTGTVEKISPDSTEDKNTGQSYYNVLVKLHNNYVEKEGKKYFIKPGMNVNADIMLAKRTIFEYLTSPLQKTISESARER